MSGPRGPLPDPNRRRRNAPTIPTTNLPASGVKKRAPKPPAWMQLGPAGLAWWKWAWRTPMAAGWSSGHAVAIARRASLEDDMAIIGEVDSLDILEIDDVETLAVARRIIGRLAALCVGRIAICREMRELDNQLGLTPKGMAALRWTIVADVVQEPAKPGTVSDIAGRRARLLASGS
jgi:hypothetical protein